VPGETQLRLFADARPLLERFGAEFFRTLPKRPGVYLMAGEADRVLYIGKAKNLRQRLSSYKYARASRKVARLTARVRTITWEICDDALAASLRENELLRLHKPTFNVLNTRSEHYPFIGIRATAESVTLWLTKSPEALRGVRHFGAFKGLPLVRAAFSALLRLLWRAEHPTQSIYDLPLRLLGNVTNGAVTAAWEAFLVEFLSGRSESLTAQIRVAYQPGNHFDEAFQTHDIELLREFFARGPERNSQLRNTFCLHDRCIAQGELDDLLVLREQYTKPITL
jgi:predicted GIY-YIG superfamily endonuclease